MKSTMKLFVIAVLAVCAVAHAAPFGKSPAITLLEYYKTHRDESRIISGQPAYQGQFPWQVALTVSFSDSTDSCGGSLIDPSWVLTAAHCLVGSAWKAKIGGIHRNVANEPGTVVVSSSYGIIHENYNNYSNNDIALMKLDEPVPLSDTIQIIRLPARSEVNDALANIKVTVSGWGSTSNSGSFSPDLNFVELDTITNKRCTVYYDPKKIISSTICAVGHREHGPCNGDTGGPLIRIAADGKPTQIGVVSFASPRGCDIGVPSAYVRTASFLDWINQHTGIPIRP